MALRIVVGTSVFVAALLEQGRPNREFLRHCLTAIYQPLLGNALASEYEAVAARPDTLQVCPVTLPEIRDLLDAFCSVCEWVPVCYLLRPKLSDEDDNRVLELAAAGNVRWIVTNNVREFSGSELVLPNITVIPPEQLLKEH